MVTKLASETRRMCSTNTHQNRPATHIRTIKGTSPRPFIGFYPECSECAARKFRQRHGTTETVRKL